jgi:hypothetical protein
MQNNDPSNKHCSHKNKLRKKRLEINMWNNADVAPIDHHFTIQSGAACNIADCTYSLMTEKPDKVESWMKHFPAEPSGYMTLLSVTNVNDEYAKKVVTLKRFPSLNLIATDKIEGGSKMSLGHVKKDRSKINLIYVGDLVVGRMIRITGIDGAQKRIRF